MEIIDERAEGLKNEGNAFYAARDYVAAMRKYSEALDIDDSVHTLWSNRSAAFLAMKDYANAASDAQRALELNSGFIKSYFRLASALSGLGRQGEATEIALRGLAIDPSNKQLKALSSSKPSTQQRPTSDIDDIPASAVDADPVRSRLYNDVMRSLKSLLRRITDREGISAQSNMLQGTYLRLMSPELFLDLMYPGIDTSVVKGVPRNVYELLGSGTAVRAELVAQLPRICESTLSILEGVRRRGAERGDQMDNATEAVLIPQISGESFALAVVDIVKKMNWKASAAYAEHCLTVASRDDERAQRDLLDSSVVDRLLENIGMSFQDEFLSTEWADLVRSDMLRFLKNEKMSDISTPTVSVTGSKSEESLVKPTTRLAWVEFATSNEEYPALAEAISSLHALPFELNAKCFEKKFATVETLPELLVPCQGSTSLTFVPRGSSASVIVDNRPDRNDNGIRLSCFYCIVATQESPGPAAKIVFSSASSRDHGPVQAEIVSDRLFLYRSVDVAVERQWASHDYFILAHYVHGAKPVPPKL